MSLVLIPVKIAAKMADGTPATGAKVYATLTVEEVDEGLIVPTTVTAVADAQGVAILNIWPNSRGVNGSKYRIVIEAQGAHFSRYITVPEAQEASWPLEFETLIDQAPYPVQTVAEQIQQAALAHMVEAKAAAVEALASANSSADSASQSTGLLSQTGVVLTQATEARDVAASAAGTAVAASDTATEQAGIATGAATTATSKANEATSANTAVVQLAAAVADDRVQTNLDREATGDDREATASDRLQTGLDRQAVAADRVATGEDAATTATNAETALTSSTAASTTLSNALAIYGSIANLNAAQQIMLGLADTAANQAAKAAQAAAAASSVAQQDLSGITAAALHRSPNAVVAMAIANTSQDSDPGWILRCGHTSWENRALNGAWAGFCDTELIARARAGTLGAELLPANPVWAAGFGTTTSTFTASGAGGTLTQAGADVSPRYVTPLTGLTVGQAYLVGVNLSGGAGAGDRYVSFSSAANGTGGSQTPAYVALSGQRYAVMVATAATMYLAANVNNAGAGASQVFAGLSVKEVKAFASSGAYYGNSTDGKFYRLWTNVLTQSEPASLAQVTTNASGTYVTLAAQTIAGYAAAMQVTANAGGTTTLFPFGGIPPTAGAPSIITFVVQMDDNTAPVVNSDGSAADFNIRLGGSIATSQSVIPIGGNAYLCVGSGVMGGSAGANGIYKMPTNSARGFRVTAWDLRYGTERGAYEKKTGDSSQSETFDGNKRQFPVKAAIVAEASRVVIYDLLEPGRPMWMVFAASGAFTMLAAGGGYAVGSLAYAQGKLAVGMPGGAGFGAQVVDFAADRAVTYAANAAYTGTFPGNIAQRNIAATPRNAAGPLSVPHIVNGSVNAVAMTTMSDAPVDPATGLQVPTIACYTSGGVSIIQNDGRVVSSGALNALSGSLTPRLLTYKATSSNVSFVPMPGLVSAGFSGTTIAQGAAPGMQGDGARWTTATMQLLANRGLWLVPQPSLNGNGPRVGGMRLNESTPAASLCFAVGPDYGIGYWPGDVRRAWGGDVSAGVVSANRVTLGTFDSDVEGFVAINGATVASVDGKLRVTSQAANYGAAQKTFATVAGKTYKVLLDIAGAVNSSVQIAGVVALGQAIRSGIWFEIPFTAIGATTTIALLTNSGVGSVVDFDNIYLDEVVADRSYKAKPLSVYGTLAKTAVATAAQLVAYSGFSAGTPQTTEYVTNGNFATGDLTGFTSGGGWSVAGGEASLNSNTGSHVLTPDAPGGLGDLRLLTFTITRVTAGRLDVRGNAPAYPVLATYTATGTYQLAVPAGTIPAFARTSETFNGAITNISIKPYGAVGSGANVLQEAPSPDLDFGTGAWWFTPGPVSIPAVLPVNSFPYLEINQIVNGDLSDGAANWTKQDGVTAAVVTGGELEIGSGTFAQQTGKTFASGRFYRVTFTARGTGAARIRASLVNGNFVAGEQLLTEVLISGITTFDMIVAAAGGKTGIAFKEQNGVGGTVYVDDVSVREVGPAIVMERAAATGPRIALGVWPDGKLVAITFDGTTPRTVTTTASYAGAGFIKPSVLYTTDGKLAINVSGVEVVSITGAPLLTMSNAAAVVTIGNSRTLDAPFPGPIVLMAKWCAGAPTADASLQMWEDEKHMLNAGAQITLPSANSITELSYDEKTGRWLVVDAANQSEFSGLVRVSTAPVSTGSISKAVASGGIKLLARTGTVPGVDITMPTQNLREELAVHPREARDLLDLDYVGGFTARTVAAAHPLQDVTPALPGALIPSGGTLAGVQITGAGLTPGSVLGSITATNIVWMDKPATATAAGIAIAFLDFILPLGHEPRGVWVNGVVKQLGATKDYTVLFDGFRYRVRFAAAPGATAWVQIKARRVV